MNPSCLAIRESILRASHQSGHGHIPTSFSVVEMLFSVYSVMRHDPQRPRWEERDLFILSKGHAALGHYAVLAHLGYIPEERLASFGSFGSDLGCHPDRHKMPGVEASTGSLGHGIGLGVGMALALKIKASPRQVYVLIGDGEANEGSVWEAMMVASDQSLGNLTVLYDDNRSQLRCLQIPNPGERLAAFGAQVEECDGHSLEELGAALRAPREPGKPRVLICHTRKGHGCATLSGDFFAWHRRAPNPQELPLLLAELRQEGGSHA